jgi:hypothetical protein
MMRTCLRTFILLLFAIAFGVFAGGQFLFAASVATPTTAANVIPTTYQILCRGNTGGVQFNNIDSRATTTGEHIVTYELLFIPSPTAAGADGRGVGPGQYSWMDRPVNAQEPNAIRFDLPFNAQLKQELNGSPVDKSPTAAERYPDALNVPEYMKNPNHYFSFFVYNTGQFYLLATSSKYWKPPTGVRVQRKPDPTEAKSTATTGAFTPPRPICDVARDARARNSPAATGLEEQCRAQLAAIGASIAKTDEEVATARTSESNNLFQQGFDIATGIFGDLAKGAWGHTATGPGSQAIRGALTAAGQRGFDASVKLHLSRDYKK